MFERRDLPCNTYFFSNFDRKYTSLIVEARKASTLAIDCPSLPLAAPREEGVLAGNLTRRLCPEGSTLHRYPYLLGQ